MTAAPSTLNILGALLRASELDAEREQRQREEAARERHAEYLRQFRREFAGIRCDPVGAYYRARREAREIAEGRAVASYAEQEAAYVERRCAEVLRAP